MNPNWTRTTNINNEKFICDICNKSYSSLQSLRYHLRDHAGNRPYKCNICGRRFSRPASIKYHIQSHTADWKHTCTICGLLLRSEQELIFHQQTHLDIYLSEPQQTEFGRFLSDLQSNALEKDSAVSSIPIPSTKIHHNFGEGLNVSPLARGTTAILTNENLHKNSNYFGLPICQQWKPTPPPTPDQVSPSEMPTSTATLRTIHEANQIRAKHGHGLEFESLGSQQPEVEVIEVQEIRTKISIPPSQMNERESRGTRRRFISSLFFTRMIKIHEEAGITHIEF